jgi:TRAP-type C4-dicarboxylate transport system substrate-binding protein
MRPIGVLLAGAFAAIAISGAAQAQLVMKASHQFPGGKGDVRDDMVQMIAKEVKAANVGIDIQVYPGASLFKPNDQWNAMVNGQLDITLFPLDYASGKVRTFSATLMPGLIRSQDRAKRINDSQFMKDIHAEIEQHGVMVLSDAWFAGGIASKNGCIVKPADMKGRKFRAAGPTFAGMWEAAGASIVSPPSNEIYNAFQTGVVNGTDTSLGTFQSMRLYEVTDCLTAPGNNALWFMYEPVLMSKKSFDKLNKQQQDAVVAAGKKAQAYYEGKADAVNKEAVKTFEDHKVKVVTLSDADYQAWLDVAKKSSYAEFAKGVPNGQKLIDEALAVK